MKTQYETTSGYIGAMGYNWERIDGPELDNMLNRAAHYNEVTREALEKVLNNGAVVKTGKKSPNYYYDHGMQLIRTITSPKSTPELVKCSCGHSVPHDSVMSASMGSSCPNCYDRMSE